MALLKAKATVRPQGPFSFLTTQAIACAFHFNKSFKVIAIGYNSPAQHCK